MLTFIGFFLVGQINIVDVANAQTAIERLQPNLTEEEVVQISYAVVNYSSDINLTWSRFTAILFQESSLKLDPKNCKLNASSCSGDYGLGQVHYSIWGEVLKINKNLMMTNYDYSIRMSAEVFKKYYKQYGSKDPNWWTRYHSKTPSLKKEYQARVNRISDKIKEIEVYRDESREPKTKNYCIFR